MAPAVGCFASNVVSCKSHLEVSVCRAVIVMGAVGALSLPNSACSERKQKHGGAAEVTQPSVMSQPSHSLSLSLPQAADEMHSGYCGIL